MKEENKVWFPEHEKELLNNLESTLTEEKLKEYLYELFYNKNPNDYYREIEVDENLIRVESRTGYRVMNITLNKENYRKQLQEEMIKFVNEN